MARFPWSVDSFTRVLLAISDDDVRESLADAFVARGVGVLAIAHARTLHTAVRRAVEEGRGGFDLVIADAALDGCSPLHALSWARTRGFTARVVIVAPVGGHVDADSDRVDAFVCSAEQAVMAAEAPASRRDLAA